MNYNELDFHYGPLKDDCWGDFDYHQNIGELYNLFEDYEIDQFIDNLDDWD